MAQEKRLYRSRNALVGGVCAGIADHFATDTLMVRLAAVLLLIITCGFAGIPYLILWANLPLEPLQGTPVDVQPEEVLSATFGAMSYEASSGAPDASTTRNGTDTDENKQRRYIIEGMLWAGALLLLAGVMSFVATFVRGVSWWQVWPLMLVIVGIMRMVLPGKDGNETAAFMIGLLCFCLGVVLLPMALGIIAWSTLHYMLTTLWPLLLAMIGCLLAGVVAKTRWLVLLGLAIGAAFCILGLLFLAQPGPLNEVHFTTPYGREYFLILR